MRNEKRRKNESESARGPWHGPEGWNADVVGALWPLPLCRNRFWKGKVGSVCASTHCAVCSYCTLLRNRVDRMKAPVPALPLRFRPPPLSAPSPSAARVVASLVCRLRLSYWGNLSRSIYNTRTYIYIFVHIYIHPPTSAMVLRPHPPPPPHESSDIFGQRKRLCGRRKRRSVDKLVYTQPTIFKHYDDASLDGHGNFDKFILVIVDFFF